MKKIVGLLIISLLVGCSTPEDRQKWATVGAVVAVGALAVAAARNGGGTTPAAVDYDWDWDQFWHQGSLIWACRGVQTGQFAERSHCAYKPQTDLRWPGK